MKELPSQEALEANARLLEKRKHFKIIPGEPIQGPPLPKHSAMEQSFDVVERLAKVGKEAALFRETITKQIGEQPYRKCEIHECEILADVEMTIRDSREAGSFVMRWKGCATCNRIKHGPEAWKVKAGIPLELCEATLDNWNPTNENETRDLQKIRNFVKKRAGFLLMLGARGKGKTHLSAAIISHFRTGRMFTQADLLYKLRQRYSDNTAEDVITVAKKARILVIDEMGLSAGGKDEFPMLHEILSHRHSNYLPTILNGNITPGELSQIIGSRMTDRLEQSLFLQIIFEGESNRRNLRADYMSA